MSNLLYVFGVLALFQSTLANAAPTELLQAISAVTVTNQVTLNELSAAQGDLQRVGSLSWPKTTLGLDGASSNVSLNVTVPLDDRGRREQAQMARLRYQQVQLKYALELKRRQYDLLNAFLRHRFLIREQQAITELGQTLEQYKEDESDALDDLELRIFEAQLVRDQVALRAQLASLQSSVSREFNVTLQDNRFTIKAESAGTVNLDQVKRTLAYQALQVQVELARTQVRLGEAYRRPKLDLSVGADYNYTDHKVTWRLGLAPSVQLQTPGLNASASLATGMNTSGRTFAPQFQVSLPGTPDLTARLDRQNLLAGEQDLKGYVENIEDGIQELNNQIRINGLDQQIAVLRIQQFQARLGEAAFVDPTSRTTLSIFMDLTKEQGYLRSLEYRYSTLSVSRFQLMDRDLREVLE